METIIWARQEYREQMVHQVIQALLVTLGHPDLEDLTDILAHLVPPVHQVLWEAMVMDIRERKVTRVILVFLVQAVSLETSL